ncbi:MAG TPA: sugar phosphate isomerase/epimerase [Candidatus Eisenbacteria bacterium]|jgi:sugar phosphate isomerase/epimerase|nr:sugar phosphate isomerase/epimerase [Candidatus Eisenbacteria bacterium]
MNNQNRRWFLKRMAGAALAMGFAHTPRLAFGKGANTPKHFRPIRLGGPIFVKTDDPEELALAHRKLGYRAAYCPKVSLDDSARIRAVADAFARHDIVVAEVGRWVNLLDADPAKRVANLKLVTEGLALADAVGALGCVDIAGSFSAKEWYGPHPDNLSVKFFEAAVENARKIIDAVKPKRAKFSYEMMGWAIPDSAESYLKLIKAVDRKAFAVHLDPCNIVNSPARFYRNTELLNEVFDKLGRWIVSCHAKDLAWDVEMNLHFREVRPGAGSMDYTTYLKRLASLRHEVPLMLEHLPSAEEYDQARSYLFDLGRKIGISFA